MVEYMAGKDCRKPRESEGGSRKVVGDVESEFSLICWYKVCQAQDESTAMLLSAAM